MLVPSPRSPCHITRIALTGEAAVLAPVVRYARRTSPSSHQTLQQRDTASMFGGTRREELAWGPDIVVVLVLFAFATRWGLDAMEFIGLTCVAGAVVGYLQVRARKRRGKRSPTTNLTRQVRERPMQRSSAPSLRHRGQRRRHEHYDPDDFDDDWDDDDWDDDDPDYYGGPSGGRRRRAESWETGDADYI